MAKFEERYVVDGQGKRVAVILGIDDYQKILEAFEELESLRASDRAKASGEEPIPFEQAVGEIEQDHH